MLAQFSEYDLLAWTRGRFVAYGAGGCSGCSPAALQLKWLFNRAFVASGGGAGPKIAKY
jgi:hypothetical protein